VTETTVDSESKFVSMEAGMICDILKRERSAESNIQILLKLDHNCRLHKHRTARALQYNKSRCNRGWTLAELFTMSKHDLTPKVKIMLSFAVARSFWEFYGDELTSVRWCSEDIWFIPQQKKIRRNQKNQKDHAKGDDLELKAFVGFPFGGNDLGPVEILEEDDTTHIYPRILSLGILLLEIANGETLGIPPLEDKDNLGDLRLDVNNAHSDARSEQMALKGKVWDMCRYKEALDSAISSCLDHEKFLESRSTREHRSKLSPAAYEELPPMEKSIEDRKRAEYQKRAVQDRRRALYHHVVSPLYWLAKIGYDDINDSTLIKTCTEQSPMLKQSTPMDRTRILETQELWDRIHHPTFHGNLPKEKCAERWFEDIRSICKMIYDRGSMIGFKLPSIRIAILDTGCDSLLKSKVGNSFKEWHDFAADPPSQCEIDEFGHGTFMARLVHQVMPGCELYIARIAQTGRQLNRSGPAIAEVSHRDLTKSLFVVLIIFYRQYDTLA
jgi:hypothetical protein